MPDVTILGVDPDPRLLSRIRRTVTGSGHAFVSARTGAEGLRRARAARPESDVGPAAPGSGRAHGGAGLGRPRAGGDRPAAGAGVDGPRARDPAAAPQSAGPGGDAPADPRGDGAVGGRPRRGAPLEARSGRG